jgi:hypothetical protein
MFFAELKFCILIPLKQVKALYHNNQQPGHLYTFEKLAWMESFWLKKRTYRRREYMGALAYVLDINAVICKKKKSLFEVRFLTVPSGTLNMHTKWLRYLGSYFNLWA